MTFFDKFRSWLHRLVQMSIILKDIPVPGPDRNHQCLLSVSMNAVHALPVSRLVFEQWMTCNATSSTPISLWPSECNKLGEGTMAQKPERFCGWNAGKLYECLVKRDQSQSSERFFLNGCTLLICFCTTLVFDRGIFFSFPTFYCCVVWTEAWQRTKMNDCYSDWSWP